MASVTLCISDTCSGGIQIISDHQPSIGQRLTPAEQAALEIVNRTRKQWGVATPPASALQPAQAPRAFEVDIDAVHRRRDGVVASA
jgi:hypothetical protein